MNKLYVFGSAALLAVLFGCSGPPTPESEFQPNPLVAEPGEETPTDERIADLLQEAKQQYDDKHYPSAFRMAEQAENLITEYEFPDEDLALAITIQGYCLLQRGQIDDYFVESFGTQEGAITKFRDALKINNEDFRSSLGIGLAQFRRHGDSIRKAESLSNGIIMMEGIAEDARRGFKDIGTPEGKAHLDEAHRKLGIFMANRDELIKLGYIFRDTTTVKKDKNGKGDEAKWLGEITEGKGKLVLEDMNWALEDAINEKTATAKDAKLVDDNARTVIQNWQKVKSHWRMRGLEDLQAARNRFLSVRKNDIAKAEELERMRYFWVDRDLTFVFQSLGAFFLDMGLEQARVQAIREGATENRVENRAREIYLDKHFSSYEKEQSKRNYEAALDYTTSFVRAHQMFEMMRINKREAADANDENSNPFMVDLVSRYQNMMDELIQEGRSVRAYMILEAAAMCIEPLFQIRDTKRANAWANELQSLDPSNPIHHFVRATAYFLGSDWETAKTEYEAFMQQSSITQDSQRRSLARMRLLQCDQNLKRSGNAGEDDTR
ncbi:MAG: hypothetical protein KDB82_03390 [Planctomycetes bacterium]|nr:hypothetical protein [Planctomycetota bacterium]